MPVIARTLAAEVAVAAREDPATDNSAVVAADGARSATNATKWDTLHVTARRIWTVATAVTVSPLSPHLLIVFFYAGSFSRNTFEIACFFSRTLIAEL